VLLQILDRKLRLQPFMMVVVLIVMVGMLVRMALRMMTIVPGFTLLLGIYAYRLSPFSPQKTILGQKDLF
jgi:hypothetical protein